MKSLLTNHLNKLIKEFEFKNQRKEHSTGIIYEGGKYFFFDILKEQKLKEIV